jgi:hypothetical protein
MTANSPQRIVALQDVSHFPVTLLDEVWDRMDRQAAEKITELGAGWDFTTDSVDTEFVSDSESHRYLLRLSVVAVNRFAGW